MSFDNEHGTVNLVGLKKKRCFDGFFSVLSAISTTILEHNVLICSNYIKKKNIVEKRSVLNQHIV